MGNYITICQPYMYSCGWTRVPNSSFFLKFSSCFLNILPQNFFKFVLIRGESLSREGPGYPTRIQRRKTTDNRYQLTVSKIDQVELVMWGNTKIWVTACRSVNTCLTCSFLITFVSLYSTQSTGQEQTDFDFIRNVLLCLFNQLVHFTS